MVKVNVIQLLPQLKQNETKAKNRNKLLILSWFSGFQTELKFRNICYGFKEKRCEVRMDTQIELESTGI